jgi:hypothetical protein
VPGETLVWGRKYNVTMQNGVFNVILGAYGWVSITAAKPNLGHTAFAS